MVAARKRRPTGRQRETRGAAQSRGRP